MSANPPKNFMCCGCGAVSIDLVKPCDCATRVGFRPSEQPNRNEYAVFMELETQRRLALSALVKTRLLGVQPEDQDLTLDDRDWMRIVAALEGH